MNVRADVQGNRIFGEPARRGSASEHMDDGSLSRDDRWARTLLLPVTVTSLRAAAQSPVARIRIIRGAGRALPRPRVTIKARSGIRDPGVSDRFSPARVGTLTIPNPPKLTYLDT